VHTPRSHASNEGKPVTFTFTHSGYHRHPRPPPIRPDGEGRQAFEEIVNIAPEIHPKNLLVGTPTRRSVSRLHPAFANLGRTAYHRRNALRKFTPGNSLGYLASYEEKINDNFIRSSAIGRNKGHFSIQTSCMRKKIIKTLTESSFQTDSVHSWIRDPYHKDVNVTITSTYCQKLKRTVIVLITVMYGKTEAQYEFHFLAFLRSLHYPTWDDFQRDFPGMTCDFSDAQRKGFENALRKLFAIPAEDDLYLERFFRFCQVHYKRSLTRVRRNHAIIPPAEEHEFYRLGILLLEVKTKPEFDEIVQEIFQRYPNIKNWMEWYLHPKRAKHIYPAMAAYDYSAIGKDTNAQESIGGDLKRTSGNKKVSPVEAGLHSVFYLHRIEEDYKLAMAGTQVRYKTSKKADKQRDKQQDKQEDKKVRWRAGEAYINDGRAPDTTKSLITVSKRKRNAGRPKGSKNKVPKLDIDVKNFGIIWSFSYNGFHGKDTCPLDTTLIACYLLLKHRGLQLPTPVKESDIGKTLSQVIERMDRAEYDHARWLWCTQAMGYEPVGTHSLFSSTEEVFLDHLPGLTCFDVEISSSCESSECPKPRNTEKKRLAVIVLRSAYVTQSSLDSALTLEKSRCSERAEIKQEKRPSYKLRRQTTVHPDDGTSITWYSCPAERIMEPVVILTTPALLVLDCLQHPANSSQSYRAPVQSLTFEGSRYHLGCVIYGNGKHFCCTISIFGRFLFYDGLRRPTVEWLVPEKNTLPRGYRIVTVWYLKSDTSSLVSDMAVRNPSLEQDTPKDVPEDAPEVAPDDARDLTSEFPYTLDALSPPPTPVVMSPTPEMSPVPETLASQRQKRMHHPTGISVSVVGQRGSLPKCKTCGQQIDRGTSRLVLRETTNEQRGWSSTSHFHLFKSCVSIIAPQYQAQIQPHLHVESDSDKKNKNKNVTCLVVSSGV